MTGTARRLFLAGTLLAFLGVAAGAFGAHWLRSFVPADLLTVFETGARYQMYHSFGLILAALTLARWPGASAAAAGRLFILGILLFSGSLYLMALTGIRWLGAITPLGGVAFLAGWACLAMAVLKAPVERTPASSI